MISKTASAILLLAVIASVNAQCPNHCSGHGKCGMYDKCKCYFGWTDGDCSSRLCREDVAWWDTPSGATAAHAPHAECSARGICDRKTGDCKCFEGFAGTSCQRTVCPGNGDCSGHGTCEYLSEMTSTYDRDNWDYDKIVGCKCDYGFNGDACQNEMCARGDDPLSPTTTKAKFTIAIEDAETYTGNYLFKFYGRTAKIPFTNNNVPQMMTDIEKSIEAIDTIKDVTVEDLSYTDAADGGATDLGVTFTLTIDKLGTKLFRVDGKGEEMYYGIDDPTIACDSGTGPDGASGATAGDTDDDGPCNEVTGTVTEVDAGAYEHMECSGRGICDYTSGSCKCFSGFTSDACDVQSALVQ